MNNEENNNERGFLALPLDLAVKMELFTDGQAGWIDAVSKDKDLVIVPVLDVDGKLIKFQRLLKKKAVIYDADLGGFMEINRIGNGFTGSDFFIDFRPDDYSGNQIVFTVTDPADIKSEDYLEPVDFDFIYDPPLLADLNSKDYGYEATIGFIEMFLKDITKFKSIEKEAYEHLNRFKKIGPQYVADIYDDIHDLHKFIAQCEEMINAIKGVNPDQDVLVPKKNQIILSARDKFHIAYKEATILVCRKAIEIMEEKKDLENMSITDLTEKMNQAVTDDEMELAAKIRDIIKAKSTTAKV